MIRLLTLCRLCRACTPVTIGILMVWLANLLSEARIAPQRKRQQEVNRLRWRGGGRKAEKSKRGPSHWRAKVSLSTWRERLWPADTARKVERLKSFGEQFCTA